MTYDALDGVVRTRSPARPPPAPFSPAPNELDADRVAAYSVSPPHGASLHAHDPKLTGSHRNDASPSAEGRHANPPRRPGRTDSDEDSDEPVADARGVNDDPSTPMDGQNPAAAPTSSS